jgi:Tfp pilus assembly protein FimT
MVTAVTLARSEAVGRGIPVSVCGKKSRDLSNLECRGSIADEDKPCPNSAAAPNPWCNGWLVFLDTGLDANPSAGDVLRSFAAPRPGSTINPAPNGTWFFSFNSRGERMPPNAVAFRLEQTDTTAQQDRCVRVAAGGMISTTHIDDGSPCP